MIVSIDYDKTWTADPESFAAIAALLKSKGHTVLMVTMRHPHETIDCGLETIYTCRQAKKDFCRSIGIEVDVWIDDSPHWIYQDAI